MNRFFLLLLSCLLLLAPVAHAQEKPWIFGWWWQHWDQDMERPYLHRSMIHHDEQWRETTWTPDEWIRQRGGNAETLLNSWYVADIIAGQDEEDGVPILLVGYNFYSLGGQDKNRVAETVDHVYGITKRGENALFQLVDARTGEHIGYYTRSGLQLK